MGPIRRFDASIHRRPRRAESCLKNSVTPVLARTRSDGDGQRIPAARIGRSGLLLAAPPGGSVPVRGGDGASGGTLSVDCHNSLITPIAR